MVRLAFLDHPAGGSAPPLLVLHGLFGAAKNWRAHAKRLAPGRRVLAVDLRNHGESPWDDRHDYDAMAGDLAALVGEVGGRAAILGHSMGGKAAMRLAETRPEMVERLLVADIAPVAYAHDLLAEIDAMEAVDLAAFARRAEVEAALAPRLADPGVRAFLAHGARLDAAPPRWATNLAAIRRWMPEIVGYPAEAGRFDGPTLFLHGGASGYVRPEHRPDALRRFPHATFEALEGAGHWLHVDRPREFLDAANRFLET